MTINKDNKIYEFIFDGIRIFNCDNPTLIYKKLFFNNDEIYIDNKKIKKIIYINELTNIEEFFNLNKDSIILEEINKENNNLSFLDINRINDIVFKINNSIGIELLETTKYDVNKIIKLVLSITSNEALNNHLLSFFLENTMCANQLFIFDNVSWINFNILKKFLNQNKFLIITNDFRKYINNSKELEIVTIINSDLNFYEILDEIKILEYICKEPLQSKQIFEKMMQNCEYSENLFYKIKKIL